MDRFDVSRIERAARRSYERGRMRMAAIAMAPAAAVVATVLLLQDWHPVACALGVALVIVGGFYLWRGRTLGRAFLPGLSAGLIPVLLANTWMALGQPECHLGGGVSLCMVVCATGGLLGGSIMAATAYHRRERASSLVFAGLVAIMTGAMGCMHLGLASFGSITVGLFVGAVLSARREAPGIS